MSKYIDSLKEKVAYNQYYIDNYDLLVRVEKLLEKADSKFGQSKIEDSIDTLKSLDIMELRKAIAISHDFFQSKEVHEKYLSLLSNLIRSSDRARDQEDNYCEIMAFYEYNHIKNDEKMSETITEEQRNDFEFKFLPVFKEHFNHKDFDYYFDLLQDFSFLSWFVYESYCASLLNEIDIKHKSIVFMLYNTVERWFNLAEYYKDKYQRATTAILVERGLFLDLDKKVKEIKSEINRLRKENKNLISEIQKVSELERKLNKEFIASNSIDYLFKNDNIDVIEGITRSSAHLALNKTIKYGSLEKLKYIMRKYHYELSENIENINDIDFDILDNNMKLLSDNNIYLSNNNLKRIIYLCKNIDLSSIVSLLHKNYLNNDIINYNISILIDDTVLNNYLKNIELLYKYNVDIISLIDINYQIIFINNDYLDKLLNMYSYYGININHKNISYLLDFKSLDIIDNYIEEDCSDIIIKHDNYIQYGNTLVKRIHISNLILDDVNVKKINEELLSEGSFFIKDKHLDDSCCSETDKYQNRDIKKYLDDSFMLNISPEVLECDMIKELDKNYQDDNKYNIGGVLISRNKVLRCLTALNNYNGNFQDKLFNSIIYNSYLSHTDIQILQSNLTNKIKSLN